MSQYPYVLIPDVLQNMRNKPISQPIRPKQPQKPKKPRPLPPEPQAINIHSHLAPDETKFQTMFIKPGLK